MTDPAPSSVDRRTFVAALVAMIAALAAAEPRVRVAGSRAARGSARAAQATGGFAALFGTPAAAEAVGQWYLATTGGEVSADALAAQVHTSLGPASTRGQKELRDAVARAVTDDLDRGDVVTLDGWIVSRTEARVCALVALERSGAA